MIIPMLIAIFFTVAFILVVSICVIASTPMPPFPTGRASRPASMVVSSSDQRADLLHGRCADRNRRGHRLARWLKVSKQFRRV